MSRHPMAVFYVVRHAKAGSRSHWQGDDRMRPLSKKGAQQAEALVTMLAPFKISSILTSPYLRCIQTVEPLARARRLAITKTSSLAEGHGLTGLYSFMREPKRLDPRNPRRGLDGAVLCTHGDVVWELVEDLVARHVVAASTQGFDKGSTWVLEVEDGTPVRARYVPAA